MKRKELERLLRQALQQQQEAANRAAQKSPWELELENRYNATKTFLDSKDYRNLPTGVNIDMLGLADSQKLRQMMRGSNQGQSAAGVNPQILAAQREMSDNQFAEDYGGEYERKIGELMGQNDINLNNLQAAHANRMGMGLSGANSMVSSISQIRPQQGFWDKFLPGILSAGGSLGSALISKF